MPRLLARARAGRLRRIGQGHNRVDLVHVENAVDAHLLAEQCLVRESFPATGNGQLPSPSLSRSAGTGPAGARPVAGRPFFITNGEPVVLWDWINELLRALGEPPVTKQIPFAAATVLGLACEAAWRVLPLRGEPPMTRFVAAELAKDHWFNLGAARRDLGYLPRVSMAEGMAGLVASLKPGTA